MTRPPLRRDLTGRHPARRKPARGQPRTGEQLPQGDARARCVGNPQRPRRAQSVSRGRTDPLPVERLAGLDTRGGRGVPGTPHHRNQGQARDRAADHGDSPLRHRPGGTPAPVRRRAHDPNRENEHRGLGAATQAAPRGARRLASGRAALHPLQDLGRVARGIQQPSFGRGVATSRRARARRGRPGHGRPPGSVGPWRPRRRAFRFIARSG